MIALVTSAGFAGGYATSSHGRSASVIAGDGASMQRDYAHHSARHLADLDAPEAIGREGFAALIPPVAEPGPGGASIVWKET